MKYKATKYTFSRYAGWQRYEAQTFDVIEDAIKYLTQYSGTLVKEATAVVHVRSDGRFDTCLEIDPAPHCREIGLFRYSVDTIVYRGIRNTADVGTIKVLEVGP